VELGRSSTSSVPIKVVVRRKVGVEYELLDDVGDAVKENVDAEVKVVEEVIEPDGCGDGLVSEVMDD